jgi:hypothetical protein
MPDFKVMTSFCFTSLKGVLFFIVGFQLTTALSRHSTLLLRTLCFLCMLGPALKSSLVDLHLLLKYGESS